MAKWSEQEAKQYLVGDSNPHHDSIVGLTYYLILQAGKHLSKKCRDWPQVIIYMGMAMDPAGNKQPLKQKLYSKLSHPRELVKLVKKTFPFSFIFIRSHCIL